MPPQRRPYAKIKILMQEQVYFVGMEKLLHELLREEKCVKTVDKDTADKECTIQHHKDFVKRIPEDSRVAQAAHG